MNDRTAFDHFLVCRNPDGSVWELGRGSMGVTYKATDVNLECPVALKVINAACFEEDVLRERFVREARTAALLRHPNIATVHHLGNSAGYYFYAMEFVEGETAKALVEQMGPMSPEMSLQAAQQVASALGEAGRRGLVHRDIKPANIMIARERDEDGWPVVKVIDFGLVRSTAGVGQSVGFVGTPLYASPEQAEERELDIRSDIYSLGCSLWFLLTGRAPFVGSVANVFLQHLKSEPPWELLRGTPPAVKTLLARMLAKKPENRFRDPVELRKQIEVCLHILSRRTALAESVWRPAALVGTWFGALPSQARVAACAGAAVLGSFVVFAAIGDSRSGNPPAASKPLPSATRLASTESREPKGNPPEVAEAPAPASPGLEASETVGSQTGIRETATPAPAAEAQAANALETVGTPTEGIVPGTQDVAISARPAPAPTSTVDVESPGTAQVAPPDSDHAPAQLDPSSNVSPRSPSSPGAAPENENSAAAEPGEPRTGGFHPPLPDPAPNSHKPRHRSSTEDRNLVPSITHLPHRIKRFITGLF